MIMRISILLMFIATMSSTRSQGVYLTHKAGFSCSTMFWGGTPRGDFKPGISLGTSAGYKISDKNFLESGIVYIQKGGSFSKDPFIYPEYKRYVSRYTLSYLVIPVSYRFYIDRHNKGFLYSGLSAGYLIKGTIREKATYRNGQSLDFKTKMNPGSLNRFDLSLQIGGGYKVKLTSASRLNFEIGCDFSLTSLYGEWYSDLVKRNIAYLASAGYEFDL